MLTDPGGPIAERYAGLGWLMIGLGTAVFLFVVAFLVIGLFREPSSRARLSENAWLVGGGIAFPLVILVLLLSFATGVLAVGGGDHAVEIEVTGYQYWWEVRYPDDDVTTANEFHIPTGVPVRLTLHSEDVIHSFWVPELVGKVDMVPGQTNHMTIEADRPGVYRGQCAEFCGVQHANMAIYVIAEEPDDYERWLSDMRAPAATPDGALAREGETVFETAPCGSCHTVRGTAADGERGPELTHFAQRRTIGAGAAPNTRGHLGGWIVDAQSIKPGSLMPPVPMSPEELRALLAYLEQLE